MSATVYFIGDLHFDHQNILKFCRGEFSTIQDHNECLVEIWNSVVKPKDVVYLMGDVSFSREGLRYVKYLNGNKHLIKGNHDKFLIMDYIDAGFQKIEGVMRYKEFVLSHVPIHPSCLEFSWEYNIHGHIHKAEKNIDDNRYINVCADMIDYTPTSIDQIRNKIKLLKNEIG